MRIVVDTNVFVSAVLKINSLPFFVVCWIDRHGGTHYDKPAKVAARCSLCSHHLALTYRLTSYDAAYLELALWRSLPLATLDDDLIRASKVAGVTVL